MLSSCIEPVILNNKHMRAFTLMVESRPLLNLIVLRFLLIPAVIKNYGYPFFKVKIIYQVIAVVMTGSINGFLRVYLGYRAKKLKQSIDNA